MAAAPGPEVLDALGAARVAWDALLAFVDARGGVTRQWKDYGAKHGWQLKLIAKGRALAYLIPREGRFTFASALRAPAIEALRGERVPRELLRAIDAAKEAPEGRPARVDVTGARELAWAKAIVDAKLTAV